MRKRIFLSPPYVGNVEKKLLNEAFDSNWIAPLGPQVKHFEKEVADYINVAGSCALSSGTAAIHLALKVLGIKKGDIVLCPSLTFVASVNPVVYENATPIFIDVNLGDWVLDIELLEATIKKYKPKFLIAVDLYGQSCDYENIKYLCNKYGVFLIEDSAEALGSVYNDKKCGSFGDISILSFNGNKIITTSGGGMLVSDNENYVEKAKFLSNQGRENFLHYEHKEVGYNYRMSNILASIGRGQLSKIKDFVKMRRKIFCKYKEAFKDLENIKFIKGKKISKSNHWLTVFRINSKKGNKYRDKIINALERENIESRPVWKPMHLQPLYKNFRYITRPNKDNSKFLFERGICLPSGSNLKEEEQDFIINIIKSIF